MKKILYIAIFLLSTVLLFSQIKLQQFTARSTSKGVEVSWKSDNENNFKNYEIERSEDGQYFQSIMTMNAKGTGYNYNYTDEEVFKQTVDDNDKVAQNGEYYYRLKVNLKDGSHDYSDEIPVIHNPSSIRKTWGMIKEMFK